MDQSLALPPFRQDDPVLLSRRQYHAYRLLVRAMSRARRRTDPVLRAQALALFIRMRTYTFGGPEAR